MREIDEIIAKYSSGKADLETTNKALEYAGYDLRLNPDKNALTEDEKNSTIIGDYPEQVSGYGLLDSGTGTLDKVKVHNGKLIGCDMGDAFAMFLIGGRTYYVDGDKIVDKEPNRKSK